MLTMSRWNTLRSTALVLLLALLPLFVPTLGADDSKDAAKPSSTFTVKSLAEEAREAKTHRLTQLAWRLWFMAQNLHREAKVIEPRFFDEAIEAFSRLGIVVEPETGDHLVYVTGALAYAPAYILDKNPDHFTVSDPENPFRIQAEELRDPERIAAARAIVEAAPDAAPEGALRAELSPAAREHLVELMVFYERVLMRQANWLANHWGKDVIAHDELTIGSRLLLYITGIDGWSSGYGYLPRAHAVNLNYVYFKIDVAGRTHGRVDEERRRQIENDLAGLDLEDAASRRLAEQVETLLLDTWLRAQEGIDPEERIFVAPGEAEAAAQAALPRDVDSEGTVTFFPGSDREKEYQEFDLEAYREGALEWRAVADLLWDHGAWDADSFRSQEESRKLLAMEHRAADRLGDLATHYTVLLLGTAGEQAMAAGETTLSAERLDAAARDLFPEAASAASRETAEADAGTSIFTEVSAEVGIHPIPNPLVTDVPGAEGPPMMSHDAFRGVATADFDRDGRLDLFIAEERGHSRLYRNAGNGKFSDVTEGSGLENLERVSGSYVADYDNDGCKDLLILRNHLSSLLFHNGCDGTFTDVTRKAGLFRENLPSTGAVWLDYDNDGHLDLYLLLTGRFDQGYVPSRGDYENAESNRMFRNLGDGTFEDVTEKIGVGDRGLGLAAAVTDFDNDGDQDIYIANDMQRNVLYENQGDGTFRNIAREAGVDDIGNGMGVSIGDVDSDGWMDMYLTNISAPPPPRFAESAQSNRLFVNRGDGTFEDVHKARLGPDITGWGWNSFFFDYDNDSYLDIYVINGFRPEFQPHNAEANLLFRARPGEPGYENVSAISGVDFKSYSRGGVFLDHDEDGDLDLVLTGLHSPLFFRNDSKAHERSWVRLELVGKHSNRDAFGARVKVVTGERVQIAEMGNQGGGFISSINAPLHFGLGEAKKIDRVEVRWPSGVRQTLTDLPVDQLHVITEPVGDGATSP